MLRKIVSRLRPQIKAAAAKAAESKSAPSAASATGGRGLRGIAKAAAAAAAKAAAARDQEASSRTGASKVAESMRNAVKKGPLGSIRRKLGLKKGGMADKEGRAMKRKTADTKGRAMKKGK